MMFRLTYIICLLALLSCNKDYHIPASVLDVYTSSNYCEADCVAALWLVKYDNNDFFGSRYSGSACPDMMRKDFYYTDGKQIAFQSDLYNKLIAEGSFERIIWQCTK